MKTKQIRQRVFIFEEGNNEEYEKFIDKNALLLTDFLLCFYQQITPSLQHKLESLQLCYFIGNPRIQQKSEAKKLESNPLLQHTSQLEKHSQEQPIEQDIIIYKVRSGEEIASNHNVIVLGDVANGARIKSKKNITIFGNCEGVIEVGGEYLILKTLKSGHIALRDEILSQEIIAKINANACLKIIIKNGDKISIKDIL